MIARKEIHYKGVWLEVECEYIEADGDGWLDPHVPAHCVLERVLVEGVNITEILDGETLDEIEKEVQP